MRTLIVHDTLDVIHLGKQGEFGATQVSFDAKGYTDCTVVILNKRNGENYPYACTGEFDGNRFIWQIGSAETAIAGKGSVEIQFYYDNALKKSETYMTFVALSVEDSETYVPTAMQTWVGMISKMTSEVMKALSEIKTLWGKMKTLENAEVVMTASRRLKPKKILTWIDDDTNSEEALDKVMEICNELDIRCSIGAIVNKIDNKNGKGVSSTKLKEMQENGYHIASHGYKHNRWYIDNEDRFGPHTLEMDLIKSLEFFKENGFIDSNYFIYPGTSATRDDINVPFICRKWCECAVTTDSNPDDVKNYGYADGRMNIHRYFIDKSTSRTVNHYTKILDNCDEDEAPWVVFGTRSGRSAEWDSVLIKDVLRYALSMGWVILPLNSAFKLRKRFYDIQEMYGVDVGLY